MDKKTNLERSTSDSSLSKSVSKQPKLMMNITPSPLSRKRFLETSLALAAAGLLPKAVIENRGNSLFLSKQIYLALDDHTDYIWTADSETYHQAFINMLDHYLDLADTTQNEDPQYQSRWNCDGNFWMWIYETNKTKAEFNRLIERIRDGHISIPLNTLSVCLGGVPAEAVLRGMYYPGRIERRYNLRFHLAYSMENQTLPFGLGALWAGSGAKYSWKGICGCASKVEDAWYYGDSISDLPVLKTVGFPVCVNPDKKLIKAAKENSWKICYWK